MITPLIRPAHLHQHLFNGLVHGALGTEEDEAAIKQWVSQVMGGMRFGMLKPCADAPATTRRLASK